MTSTKRLAKNAVLYYEVSSKYKGYYLSASEVGQGVLGREVLLNIGRGWVKTVVLWLILSID